MGKQIKPPGLVSLIGILTLVAGANAGVAQSVDPNYEIGTWHGFRPAAVSHTFDDNDANQLAVAVPMFNEFGLKLTLFALTGASWRPIDWVGLVEAAAQGHEIAGHTVTHPTLTDLSLDQQRVELEASHDAIVEHIPEQSALTLAYPFCVAGDRGLTETYYIAARACQGRVESRTPSDMLNISSIVVGSEGSVQTAAHLNNRVESAVRARGWAVFLSHGIDNDGGWSPVASDELRGHLEYLAEHKDTFWVATFGHVVRYLRERDAASVIEISAEADRITLEVTDTLDDTIYNVPLSVRRLLPGDWESATATQQDIPVPVRVVEENDERYVMFDAVPDGGEVVLAQSVATGAETNDQPKRAFATVRSYPNPFSPTTSIVYYVPEAGWVRLEVYDLLGRQLETLVNTSLLPGRHITHWDATGYVAGTYVYRLVTATQAASGMMTLTP